MALAVAHARAQHLAGEPAKASTAWARLIPLLEEHGAHFLAVKAKLYATATLAATGEQARASASLAAVTVDMEARGYGFLRKLDAPLWAELAGLVAEPAPTVAKVKITAPTPVAKPTGGALLDIRCFGSVELRLDGRLLEDWPRRKAKRVLAALALQPAGMEVLELAMAIGESDDETGLNALRTSVMALRRVLEPSLGKGEVSAFVRSTATGYALALETVANNDVQAFTQAVDRADAVLKHEGPAPAFAAYDAALSFGAAVRAEVSTRPLSIAPSAIAMRGADNSPSTFAVLRSSMRSSAITLPATVPATTSLWRWVNDCASS